MAKAVKDLISSTHRTTARRRREEGQRLTRRREQVRVTADQTGWALIVRRGPSKTGLV